MAAQQGPPDPSLSRACRDLSRECVASLLASEAAGMPVWLLRAVHVHGLGRSSGKKSENEAINPAGQPSSLR